MQPEELLHLLGPYLPTDRFRALLRNSALPRTTHGASMLVDISGFTPMTTRLVAEYGPQRASEELKRRINPMFEAIAGQVFQHGGSVIRFLGDGFTAWFDDQPIGWETTLKERSQPVPGALRAAAAGLEMQSLMRLFRGLRLKVCIGAGAAERLVVGVPDHGLTDILSGPAVQGMVSLTGEAQPDQVMIHHDAIPLLRAQQATMEIAETGNALVTAMPDEAVQESRRHRWPAWAVEGNIHETLDAVRPFVNAAVRARVESGFGDYVGELRSALPLFIQIRAADDAALDNFVRIAQASLATSGGQLMSVEVSDKGSVLFAVFGAPVTYGDDAERALRVAVGLRDLAADVTGIHCIGISRGLLYAGTVGGEVRHEYSTIGDETNIAARLMTVAAQGQVLVSSAVRKQAGPRVVFRELSPINVKGREEPIPVYEPIAIRSGMERHLHAGRLIGRENELNEFRRLIRIVKNGQPRVVRIEGDAGIGKSRLVTELIGIAAGQNFHIAGGDCVSTGRNTVYLPWQELLYSLFNLSAEADPDTNIAALSQTVESVFAAALPRLPLLRDVLRLPIADTLTTLALEGRTRRQALFALVTDLLIHKARQQPLLLIIEDAQWLDEVSEALAIDLVRRLSVESAPLLFAFVHRTLIESDSMYGLIGALAEVHFHARIVVSELSRDDVGGLIEHYLNASIPPALTQFVYERAQGNPFFIQEVLDTLLETGYARVANGRAAIVGDLATADLPQTVQGLIQARIDRLNDMEKLVLKVAAVIGREFQMRILKGSIPVQMTQDELLAHLRTLEERDFSLLAEGEPDLTYLFRHAITQEVTYQSLLFAQRQQLHHAVAATLEALTPDATERLAYHFSRSGDRDRARHYLIQAGKKAFAEYANQSALDYFTQALDFAEDPDERFEISRQRLQVRLRLGDTQNVLAEIPEMQARAEGDGRLDWQAAVHTFWADYYTQTSAWADAIREAQTAINFAEACGQDALAWEAYLLLRGAMLSLNQRSQVVRSDLDRKMQAIAERMGDQRHVIELILTWFDDLYSEGPEIAIQGAQTALSRAEELQDPVLEASCWSVLVDLYLRESNLIAALEAARKQIALLRQIGDRRHEGLTLTRIGGLLANLGQLSEASAHLNDAYRILHQIGERSGEALNLAFLGIVAEFYSAYEEALAYMNRALVIQRALNAEVDIALTLFYRANVLLARGAPDEAEPSLKEARAILEANSRIPFILPVAEVDAAIAEIDMLRDDTAGARVRITPLVARLQRRQVAGLYRPGLAYWRAAQVMEKDGQIETAAALRNAFRIVAAPTLDWLKQRGAAQGFTQHIWYHAALLSDC